MINQLSGRSAVFLDEMGVGPLWGLRHAEPGLAPELALEQREPEPEQAPAGAAGSDAAADADTAFAADAVAAPVIAIAPQVERVPGQPAPAAPVSPALAVDATAKAPPLPVVQTIAAGDDSTAWFDDAPPPPPAVAVTDEAIAAMGWDELKAAVAKCTRCDLCRTRRSAVPGRGAQRAAWLVVGAAPSRADERQASAISGDAGKLLDNMMLAVGQQPAQHVYVTSLVKCRPAEERAPTAAEIAACKPFLQREMALTGAATMLALGQGTLKAVLGDGAPATRGTVYQLGQLAVVATYHPEDLLRQSENKARAWADLCLAKAAHARRG
jgi:uracil-DNA glycosylase family 4